MGLQAHREPSTASLQRVVILSGDAEQVGHFALGEPEPAANPPKVRTDHARKMLTFA